MPEVGNVRSWRCLKLDNEERLKEEMLKEEKLKEERLKEERLKAERLKEERLKEERLKEENVHLVVAVGGVGRGGVRIHSVLI